MSLPLKTCAFISIFSMLISACLPQQSQDCALSYRDAAGTWAVALYFDPPNPPSQTELVFKFDDEGEMSGSFYGSEFERSNGVLFENEYAFTAVTSDGTGPYIHSGRLKCDGKLYGQTLSEGRDFIMPWIATRGTAQ